MSLQMPPGDYVWDVLRSTCVECQMEEPLRVSFSFHISLSFTRSLLDMRTAAPPSFAITAPPETDVWRKPPNTERLVLGPTVKIDVLS